MRKTSGLAFLGDIFGASLVACGENKTKNKFVGGSLSSGGTGEDGVLTLKGAAR